MGSSDGEGYWQHQARRLSRRRLLAGGAAVGAGITLAACGGSSSTSSKKSSTSSTTNSGSTSSGTTAAAAATGTPKTGGTWRQATITQAPHFSPYHPGADPSFVNTWRRTYGYYERLWEFGSTDAEKQANTYHRIDRLAASTEQVDPMTVVVKLKPSNFQNLPPANGRPMTAADFVADIEFLKHPPASGGTFIQSGKDLKSVTAVDDQTLRFDMFGPRAFFFESILPVSIVPKEMLDEKTLKTTPPVGNGPFMYKGGQQGSREEAVANPDYYVKGQPYIQNKTLTFVPDSATLEASFRAGQLDDLPEDFTDIKQEQSIKQDLGNKIQTRDEPSASGMALLVNIHRPPFNDPRVREAIYRAINVDRVNTTVFFGDAYRTWYYAKGLYSRFPLPWDAVQQYVGYDPQKATQLLKAAGVDPNHAYDFMVPVEAQTWVDSAKLYAEDLAKVGLKTQLSPIVRNIYLQKAGPKPGAFDITMSVLLDYQYAQTHSGTFWDNTSLEDPEVDALVTQIMQTVDNKQRQQLSHQFEMMLAQKYSNLMPLLSANAHHGWYSYMKGIDWTYNWQDYQPARWIDKA